MIRTIDLKSIARSLKGYRELKLRSLKQHTYSIAVATILIRLHIHGKSRFSCLYLLMSTIQQNLELEIE